MCLTAAVLLKHLLLDVVHAMGGSCLCGHICAISTGMRKMSLGTVSVRFPPCSGFGVSPSHEINQTRSAGWELGKEALQLQLAPFTSRCVQYITDMYNYIE